MLFPSLTLKHPNPLYHWSSQAYYTLHPEIQLLLPLSQSMWRAFRMALPKLSFLFSNGDFQGTGTRSLAYQLPIRDTWYSVCIVNIQAGLSLRAWPVNYTCYRWVCLIFSWCYMWNCILFVEFNHKVTILLWRTSLQVTQNSPAKVSEYLGGFLKPATKWTYASGENQLTLFCLKYGIIVTQSTTVLLATKVCISYSLIMSSITLLRFI